MGKGQAAILLIIVAIAVVFLFFSPQIFGPQTPQAPPVSFKNDVITLENFQVSNLRPFKESIVTISFDVKNNGDKDVQSVVIDFGGTTLGSLDDIDVITCEGGVEKTEESLKHILKIPIPFTNRVVKQLCVFDKIQSLDARRVTANYKVVNEGTRTILVKVTYPYEGSREALIPIIDDTTVRKPPVQFKQSQPSYGPFVVDVIPPTKGWAIRDQPFEIKFKLRYIGSALAGLPTTDADELKIEKKKFTVELSELALAKINNKIISCQFEGGAVGDKDYTMVNTDRDIVVNKEYNCNLQAIVSSIDIFGYKLGKVGVTFSYIFEFQKSQAINVIKPS